MCVCVWFGGGASRRRKAGFCQARFFWGGHPSPSIGPPFLIFKIEIFQNAFRGFGRTPPSQALGFWCMPPAWPRTARYFTPLMTKHTDILSARHRKLHRSLDPAAARPTPPLRSPRLVPGSIPHCSTFFPLRIVRSCPPDAPARLRSSSSVESRPPPNCRPPSRRQGRPGSASLPLPGPLQAPQPGPPPISPAAPRPPLTL